MVFLSQVGFACKIGTDGHYQLKDPHARSFSHMELRAAMMSTIAFINQLSKEVGVVSVSYLSA